MDSVTSLVQNSLFPVERDYAMDLAGAQRCGDGLVAFARQVANAVFVSDAICCMRTAGGAGSAWREKIDADYARRGR